MYAQTVRFSSRDESRTRRRAVSHHTKMGGMETSNLWAHAFGTKKTTLHVGCCAHLNVSTHIAASRKAGPRGGPVSSHVFANIGGLACLPSIRGAWRIGCHRAAIISELIITTLACSVA